MIRTPKLVERARRLYDRGHNYREIGERLGISTTAAYDWVNGLHGDGKRGRKPVLPPARELLENVLTGTTVEELAETYDVTSQAVYARIRRTGRSVREVTR